MYKYELEKGSKKFVWPGCGKKTFTRTVDTTTGNYLPDHVGRCDREANCGYHYKWKQYFTENPEGRRARFNSVMNGPQTEGEIRVAEMKPDYLDIAELLQILTGYENNTFVEILLTLFPNDPDDVIRAVQDYLIGTKDRFTVFPTISKYGRFCKAKLIKFNPETGKRIKDGFGISSLEAKLKMVGRLKADFKTDKDVFFGEHLLTKYPGIPVAIVESEKTAVIGSICRGLFPEMIWLACGSGGWLKTERLRRIGRDRPILLFPDADAKGYWFKKWLTIAIEARKFCLKAQVSDLVETRATKEEKKLGFDIADYLIREQVLANKVDRAIELIKSDKEFNADFESICDERQAIMTIEGGLADEEAAQYIQSWKFRTSVISSLNIPDFPEIITGDQ